MDYTVLPNQVLELDYTGRERTFKYAHINVLLYPDYYIVRAGTTADLYSAKTQKIITGLFLHWDNKKIFLGNEIKGFSECVKKFEENGFSVKIEKLGWLST